MSKHGKASRAWTLHGGFTLHLHRLGRGPTTKLGKYPKSQSLRVPNVHVLSVIPIRAVVRLARAHSRA